MIFRLDGIAQKALRNFLYNCTGEFVKYNPFLVDNFKEDDLVIYFEYRVEVSSSFRL